MDSSVVDYIVNNFTLQQVREEAIQADKKRFFAKDEHDTKKEIFFKEYAESCRMAIEVMNGVKPKPELKPGQQPRESADDIKARYDLADYINQYTNLKKVGQRYYGLCPLHNDKKSPSLVVYPENIFHCYGCQAHGSVIDFVMKYENLSLKDALVKLSR